MLEMIGNLLESLLDKLIEHIETESLASFVEHMADYLIDRPTSPLAIAIYIGFALCIAGAAIVWRRLQKSPAVR